MGRREHFDRGIVGWSGDWDELHDLVGPHDQIYAEPYHGNPNPSTARVAAEWGASGSALRRYGTSGELHPEALSEIDHLLANHPALQVDDRDVDHVMRLRNEVAGRLEKKDG